MTISSANIPTIVHRDAGWITALACIALGLFVIAIGAPAPAQADYERGIAAYAEGWTLGDSEKIMSAASRDLVLDDPNVGKITRDALPDYIAGLKSAVSELRAAPNTCRPINARE